MKTHTPGPWMAVPDRCHFDTLSSIVGGKCDKNRERLKYPLMAEVGGHAEWREQEANTRLMASAPELLEALTDLYDATPDNDKGPLGEACLKARKAIAKALGEQIP